MVLVTPLDEQFVNLGAVLPDEVVVYEHGEVYHRRALDENRPACGAAIRDGATWKRVEVDVARRHGRPCRSCFEPVVEHAAADPSSPVEQIAPAPTDGEQLARADGADLASDVTTPRRPPLAAPTAEVATGTGKLHAPLDRDGATLCGREASRVVDRRVVEPTRDYCRDCFDVDAFPDE